MGLKVPLYCSTLRYESNIYLTNNTFRWRNSFSTNTPTIEMGTVMVDSLNHISNKKTITITTETLVARLYRYKNARVNKELGFITAKGYGKLA